MIVEDAIHDAVDGLKNVRWRETAFADLQWYYAEEGVYILRCKKGDPNEHLCIIQAKSADEAISRAVFNLYKADEKKSAPVGDMAAMREALVAVKKSIDGIGASSLDGDPEILMMSLTQVCARLSARIDAALAAPPRNCDVGTAEEQEKRFGELCTSHSIDGARGVCDVKCPFYGMEYGSDCALYWAQMPCETGESKEKDGSQG